MNDNTVVTTQETTPQFEHQKKLINQTKVAKEGLKITEEWHEIAGVKLIRCYKKKNGNSHREYVGRVDKCKDLIADLKKKKQLRQ